MKYLFIDIRKSDEVYSKHFDQSQEYSFYHIPMNMIRFNAETIINHLEYVAWGICSIPYLIAPHPVKRMADTRSVRPHHEGLSTMEDIDSTATDNVELDTSDNHRRDMDDDILAGDYSDDDDADESASLLNCVARYMYGRQPATVTHMMPPDPSSPHYIADLLQYEFNRSSRRRRFCYLRCLEAPDRAAFQTKMSQLIKRNCRDKEHQERIITQGTIELRTWKEIMKKIPLFSTYKLWRVAYWGENAGRKVTRYNPMNYHVLMATFVGHPNGRFVNLLHTPGHIEQVPTALIFPALGEDPDVTSQAWGEICD